MTLYELQEKYTKLIELADEGFDIEEALDQLDDSLEVKAENYAKLIKNVEADTVALNREIERLKDMENSKENFIKRLKNNLFKAMTVTGKEKIETPLFKIRIQTNGGKAPLVTTFEKIDDLPADLVNVSKSVNVDALKKYIEETGDLTYGYIAERGKSLRIR